MGRRSLHLERTDPRVDFNMICVEMNLILFLKICLKHGKSQIKTVKLYKNNMKKNYSKQDNGMEINGMIRISF